LTLYDDAWMPNMQRITWNGIALHGGPLPGYAASHGCVRMPYDFAAKAAGAVGKARHTALSLNLPISALAACCARSARPVQIYDYWRIEAPRNRFSRSTFALKLGRKAARGLGFGGSAAAIYSHSQKCRDLFALNHALS
jgi:hypothetical protein